MPAKDLFHDAVKVSLEKEGWVITADPLTIEFGEDTVFVDLGAERVIAAQKDEQKIAVEIKSFLSTSVLYEFHAALGQYLNYNRVLKIVEPERLLYLAISEDAQRSLLKSDVARLAIEQERIRLIVFDPEKEVTVLWTS